MTGDALCEICNGWFGNTSARYHLASDMHESIEEGASSDDHTFGVEFCAPDGPDADGTDSSFS